MDCVILPPPPNRTSRPSIFLTPFEMSISRLSIFQSLWPPREETKPGVGMLSRPNLFAVAKDFSSSHSVSITPLDGPRGRPMLNIKPSSNHPAITSSSVVTCRSQSS